MAFVQVTGAGNGFNALDMGWTRNDMFFTPSEHALSFLFADEHNLG